MAKSSGTAVFIVVLLGIALASADDDGLTGSDTAAGVDSGDADGDGIDFGFGEAGDPCGGVSSYDDDGGNYVVPTESDDDLLGARNCVLDGTHGGGAPVLVLQTALATCYGQPVGADGTYGPGTAAAVQAAQTTHGLPADGVFGPQTSEAMMWPTTSATGQVTCMSH
jgi:hypothetical protein